MLPRFSLDMQGDRLVVTASGDWVLSTIGSIEEDLVEALEPIDTKKVDYDFEALGHLDTAGAYTLARAIRCEDNQCHTWKILDSPPQDAVATKSQTLLMQLAADAAMGRPPPSTRPWYDALSRIGEAVVRGTNECIDTMAFLGKFIMVFFRVIRQPSRIRWQAIVALIEDVGLDAAPIVILLSFFIGAVIAFMGANLLASFGAQIFMVDLVGFSVLREFACLITAIILAGRSDSAFTAQIGAMKMRQEVDAMTVIGLDTYETLVLPRAVACLVSTPILTFAAMMSGLFGGMLVAWLGPTDISPVLFFARLREAVEINHFLVGMVKTPFFAILIAVIGCRQGLAVEGSVESLGSRTTSSVVQAIFAVIVMDAIFAMLFLQMGV